MSLEQLDESGKRLTLAVPLTSPKGRVAEQSETALLTIDAGRSHCLLEMVRLFGMLSEAHKGDILAILDAIIASVA